MQFFLYVMQKEGAPFEFSVQAKPQPINNNMHPNQVNIFLEEARR
jgi:hypothetical protein